MLFKIVLFCFLLVYCYAANEGEPCTRSDGLQGTCTLLTRCLTAVEYIRQKKNPQICSFVGLDPIVCCFDYEPQNVPLSLQLGVATTTIKPLRPTTSKYVPPDFDYVETGGKYPECADIPVSWTTDRTGQTAFDKCIEYQEKYVYPCERTVTFSDDMVRGHHCRHDTDGLLPHGLEVAKHEMSHMVTLGFGDDLDNVRWLCGGSVISENFILTAAHCTRSLQDGNVTYVVVGAVTLKEQGDRANTFKVKRAIPHPNWKRSSLYNDIALLELENPMTLSQFLVPACLDVGGPVNDSHVLAGTWGYNSRAQIFKDTLQKITLRKHPVKVCSDKYEASRRAALGFDPQLQYCFGATQPDRDTCQGDSGSGILVKSKAVHCMYIVVGVTSYGRGFCGNVEEPAIYTRVVAYVPWIESIVWP